MQVVLPQIKSLFLYERSVKFANIGATGEVFCFNWCRQAFTNLWIVEEF